MNAAGGAWPGGGPNPCRAVVSKSTMAQSSVAVSSETPAFSVTAFNASESANVSRLRPVEPYAQPTGAFEVAFDNAPPPQETESPLLCPAPGCQYPTIPTTGCRHASVYTGGEAASFASISMRTR